MARIVIAGARGFIGGHLVRFLAGRHRVWCLARDVGEALPGVTWIQCDLASSALSLAALPESVDVVIHLAQSRAYADFPEGSGDVLAVNVDSAVRLADWAWRHGVDRYIYLSSGGITGGAQLPVTEAAPIRIGGPLAYYLGSKFAAETLLGAYTSLLKVIILRPFFVYGPGQPARMLIPRLVSRIRCGEPITIRKPVDFHFNPIHVTDAVRLIEAAFGLVESTTVNLAGPQVTCIREVASLAADLLGVQPCFQDGDDEAVEHLVADTGRMEALLGRGSLGMAAGIRSMITQQN